jgi:hypothetical protein
VSLAREAFKDRDLRLGILATAIDDGQVLVGFRRNCDTLGL